MLRPVSEILEQLLDDLQSTGAPAFVHKDLPRLCNILLEVLDHSNEFAGCFSQGETLRNNAPLAWSCMLQLGSSVRFVLGRLCL